MPYPICRTYCLHAARTRPLARRAILAAACLVAAGGTARADAPTATTELTFVQAEQRLAETSDALAAATAGSSARRDLAQATRSLRLPDVALDVRELEFRKSLEVSLGPLAPVLEPLGVPGTLDLSEQDWRLRPAVTATLPLYSGGRIPAVQQAAEAGVRQADAELHAERQTQGLRLIQLYFGQQLAERVLAVRTDVRDGLQRHLDDTAKLEREGLATKAQRLQATVARDQAERDLQRAISERATVASSLSQLLRTDDEVRARSPLFVLSTPLTDVTALREAARDRQPQVARLRAASDQAEQAVKLREAELKPQVFLFGQYDLHQQDALLTEPDWIFGIGLRYALVSGSDRPRQVSAAKKQLEQTRAGLREAINQVETAVMQTFNTLEETRRQFLLLDSSLDEATENMRLQELSFREGQATSLDVIDARLRLGDVAAQRAQAAYRYDLTLGQLLAATGQLEQFPHFLDRADKVISP